jgi:hypothetical protein
VKNTLIGLGTLLVVLIAGCWLTQKGSDTPTQTKQPDFSYAERLKDGTCRAAYAEQCLKLILRDPDSLVVESTGFYRPVKINGSDYLVYPVRYHAKNGFGGFSRGSAYILGDVSGNGQKAIDQDQYDWLVNPPEEPSHIIIQHRKGALTAPSSGNG